MLKMLTSFRRNQDGVAATEFALIAPIMITLMLGVIEFSKYSLIDRRTEMTVHMVAEFLSRDDDSWMTYEERTMVDGMNYITNPTGAFDNAGIAGSQRGVNFSLSYASVDFDKRDPTCQGINCEFDPRPLWVMDQWSATLGEMRSTCNVSIVPNGTPLTGSTIPEGMVGNSGLVRAQVGIGYAPLFQNSYLPTFVIKHSSLKKTRDGRPLNVTRRASWRRTRC